MRIGNVHTMSMSVNVSMNNNNAAMSTALSRLSSGLRINTAADDASGMTIANSLITQAHAVSQEVQNKNDEIGMLQVADQAMSEQTNILETIKTKLVQRANDTQDTQSKLAIDRDIEKLLKSYNEIVDTTQYNGKKLLSGTFESQNGLDIHSTKVGKIGHTKLQEFDSITAAGSTVFTITKGDDVISFREVDIGHEDGSGIGKLAQVLNAQSGQTGIVASYSVKTVSQESIEGGTINDLIINGVDIGSIVFEDADRDNTLVSAINLKTSYTGISASVNSEGKLVLDSQDGRGIKLENAESLKVLSENYGKLSLTQSGGAAVQVDATGVFEKMSFTNKFSTLDYINSEKTFTAAGTLGQDTSSVTSKILTSSMITNYSGGDSGVYNTSDLMNVAAARDKYSLDGAGYTVVVIDTGIDAGHDFFDDRVVQNLDFTGEGLTSDTEGHGTHVASIIGSSDSTYSGVTPGVDLIGLKSLKDNGTGSSLYTEAALQWVIDNADAYDITAVNMSLGNGTNDDSPQDALNVYGDELQTLAEMGIINVAAAGNDYADNDPDQGAAYPGNSLYTIGVGSVRAGDASSPDALSIFSQRSTEVVDIFAVGDPVIAADSLGAIDATNQVTSKQGTSMASPQVAGIVTLVQEYSEREFGRKLSFDEMKDLLVNTAVTINDGDDAYETTNGVTATNEDYKRIDALGALDALAAIKESLSEVSLDPDTDTSTLNITVVDPTEATQDGNEVRSTAQGEELGGNVLDNLFDSDSTSHSVTTFTVDGDNTTYTAGQTASTSAGDIKLEADGTFTFTPTTFYTGEVPQVSYNTLDNTNGGTDSSTLDIEVIKAGSDLQDADELETIEKNATIEGNLLRNKYDTDSFNHSITTFSIGGLNYDAGESVTLDSGVITIEADGSYIFDSAEEFTGSVPEITYTIADDDHLGLIRGSYTYDNAENNTSENFYTSHGMSILDNALTQLDTARSSIGSTQNMLLSDINYKSIQNVNLMNSASQLQDADFAVESAQLSKSLILVQASSYAFSQINQRYQMIERLLA